MFYYYLLELQSINQNAFYNKRRYAEKIIIVTEKKTK